MPMVIDLMGRLRIHSLSLWRLLLLFGILVVNTSRALSQVDLIWTPHERIPGYADETLTPFLISDQNRTVHAFTSQWVGEHNPQLAVVYNQWSLEGGWTPVVDILLSPLEQARVMGVHLDANGIMHLIFFGGDDRNANIYYSKALAVEAGRATAWMEPQIIGWDANTPSTASLIGDDEGNLFVVFSGKSYGNGLYSIHSTNSGKTWSELTPIYLTENDELWPTALQLSMDKQQRLHIVWSIVDSTGNGLEITYTRIGSNQVQDIYPTVLATVTDYEADWPSIVNYRDEIFLIYNNGQPATRWFIKSSDGGITWTEPVRPFSHVGEYGHASFITDSNDNLYMILGNRIGNPAIHGMWYSKWKDYYWQDLEPIVMGPRVIAQPGKGGYDPSRPTAVIVQGNVLLVVWRTDPGAGLNGIWYSYTFINSPELPISPLPTIQITEKETTVPTPRLQINNEREKEQLPQDRYLVSDNPVYPITFSLIPAALIVLVVIIITRKRIG